MLKLINLDNKWNKMGNKEYNNNFKKLNKKNNLLEVENSYKKWDKIFILKVIKQVIMIEYREINISKKKI